ncbi:hypothetical protein LS68_008105 [Helicobacter sp. MIT 05-5293]|uniref:hypothetical protein n=1 Tax=Helicobacter sp. MIT 05-5293 TaxID=1548149 RepID=UPI00051D1DF3|nr:hypothetical protein [Helicobacter sp. MIT 05-5293]TLD80171.1 hypothetical protein LS68_008105 [Helicobacter sp. MIT 05-5293]
MNLAKDSAFEKFAKDIAHILPEEFYALGRKRKTLSNASTKIVYDIASSTELTLLTLSSENTDLQVGTIIEYQNKTYKIYQIDIESRVMKRLFLKEENVYAYQK